MHRRFLLILFLIPQFHPLPRSGCRLLLGMWSDEF